MLIWLRCVWSIMATARPASAILARPSLLSRMLADLICIVHKVLSALHGWHAGICPKGTGEEGPPLQQFKHPPAAVRSVMPCIKRAHIEVKHASRMQVRQASRNVKCNLLSPAPQGRI